eukprot:252377-Rhodomonas_salina.3
MLQYYAMVGTEIEAMVLRCDRLWYYAATLYTVWYCEEEKTLCCYAVFGSDLGYAATGHASQG